MTGDRMHYKLIRTDDYQMKAAVETRLKLNRTGFSGDVAAHDVFNQAYHEVHVSFSLLKAPRSPKHNVVRYLM